MTPEQILANPPKVLSQAEREFYFDQGYLLLEKFVSQEWLERIWAVTNRFVEESRGQTQSDDKFDLEPTHTAEAPRLRRLKTPVSHDPLYWEFASRGPLVDLAEDLMGPNLKFHHQKLNFKWAEGGEEVKWHQDIQFYPHTNYSVAAFGLCLADVTGEMGPMGVIPGSHQGELYDQYNDKDQWVGALSDQDVARLDLDKAVWLTGPAGSVTVHNCRTVHGSAPNNSAQMRPLLLQTYTSADAFAITPNASPSPYDGALVRGRRARWAHFDPRPCQIPPDWSGGYSSIFSLQQEEEQSRAVAAE